MTHRNPKSAQTVAVATPCWPAPVSAITRCFAHPARKQRLAQGVIDLVRAGVQKVFAFEINLRAARVCSQPLRVKQWCWSASVIAQQQIEFAPEIIVVSRARELVGQLLERRDQCFRNVAATEFTPVAVFVRLARCDHKWRCSC